jgi:CDP-diacylglycerol--glycerol-3-phosphate 3-phosphatidyltransferase
MISVSILGYLPWWITGVILGRELAVTALRILVVKKNAGKVIPASRGGKIKTTMQGFSTGFYVLPLSTTFHTPRDLFMYATIAVTLYTGAQYFQAALKKDK